MSNLYKEAKSRWQKEVAKKRARGEDVSQEIQNSPHLRGKIERAGTLSDAQRKRQSERHRDSQKEHKEVRGLGKNKSFDVLNPSARPLYSGNQSSTSTYHPNRVGSINTVGENLRSSNTKGSAKQKVREQVSFAAHDRARSPNAGTRKRSIEEARSKSDKMHEKIVGAPSRERNAIAKANLERTRDAFQQAALNDRDRRGSPVAANATRENIVKSPNHSEPTKKTKIGDQKYLGSRRSSSGKSKGEGGPKVSGFNGERYGGANSKKTDPPPKPKAESAPKPKIESSAAAPAAAKPKFLSTRKGKAIAAGGALAAAGALGGAYAYKKHLDKKKEEVNDRKNS